jgi:tetratricopeptide (TPR) repeat protein|tara:strand:- start:116 stop:886 length:771 start_codon:yes stop_codon:yes gene_type:complete
MKNTLLALLGLFLNLFMTGQSPDELFSQGNEAYNDGLYEKAIDSYEKILNQKVHSVAVYFNLGNTYYRMGSIAESIFYFEMANKLSPNEKDVINNIKYAKNMSLDSIEELPKSQFAIIIEKIMNFLSINNWTNLTLFFAWLFSSLFAVYIWNRESIIKRIFFIASIMTFFLLSTSFIILHNKENIIEENNAGIVFEKQINVQSEPNFRSDILFNLNEGTKIIVLEKLEEWLKIRIANGAEGWIENKSIKFLNYKKL